MKHLWRLALQHRGRKMPAVMPEPLHPVQIEGFIRDGASRILSWLPSGKTDEVLAEMDRVADVVKRF